MPAIQPVTSPPAAIKRPDANAQLRFFGTARVQFSGNKSVQLDERQQELLAAVYQLAGKDAWQTYEQKKAERKQTLDNVSSLRKLWLQLRQGEPKPPKVTVRRLAEFLDDVHLKDVDPEHNAEQLDAFKDELWKSLIGDGQLLVTPRGWTPARANRLQFFELSLTEKGKKALHEVQSKSV